MGRGLSDLQRYILTEASRRKRLYYAEVLVGFFGWPVARELERWGEGRYANDPRGTRGDLVSPGTQFFSRQEIGEKRYRTAMASLSRACQRLAARGLVKCLQGAIARWAGVEITDKGRDWLLVKTAANLPQYQPIAPSPAPIG